MHTCAHGPAGPQTLHTNMHFSPVQSHTPTAVSVPLTGRHICVCTHQHTHAHTLTLCWSLSPSCLSENYHLLLPVLWGTECFQKCMTRCLAPVWREEVMPLDPMLVVRAGAGCSGSRRQGWGQESLTSTLMAGTVAEGACPISEVSGPHG